jgi:metal-responsive CopG/Arc/MetJ family transcriptional regulator
MMQQRGPKRLPVAAKKRVIAVSLSPAVIKMVDAVAKREQRSRSNVIEVFLRQCVDRRAA